MPIINLGPLGSHKMHLEKVCSDPILPISAPEPPPVSYGKSTSTRKSSVPEDDPPPYSTINSTTSIRESSFQAPVQSAPLIDSQVIPEQGPLKTISLQWNAPAPAEESTRVQCATQQFRRCLLEIISLTLDADFDALNLALYGQGHIVNTNSMLAPSERNNLLDPSRLAARASKVVGAGNSIHELDVQDLQQRLIAAWDKFDHRNRCMC
jgi:hypothetical protein